MIGDSRNSFTKMIHESVSPTWICPDEIKRFHFRTCQWTLISTRACSRRRYGSSREFMKSSRRSSKSIVRRISMYPSVSSVIHLSVRFSVLEEMWLEDRFKKKRNRPENFCNLITICHVDQYDLVNCSVAKSYTTCWWTSSDPSDRRKYNDFVIFIYAFYDNWTTLNDLS